MEDYEGDDRVEFRIYDNNVDGRPPVLVYSRKSGQETGQIHDKELFDNIKKTTYDINEDGNYERKEKIDEAYIRERESEIVERVNGLVVGYNANVSRGPAGEGLQQETQRGEGEVPGGLVSTGDKVRGEVAKPRKLTDVISEIKSPDQPAQGKQPLGLNRLKDNYRGTATEYTHENQTLDDDLGDDEIRGDASKGSRKYVFLQDGKAIIKEIAKLLGFNDADVTINPGGVAVSGEVYASIYPTKESTVSIHAPTRGATCPPAPHYVRADVSIHAPTRGATSFSFVLLNIIKFQSTRPRGARHHGRCE